MSCSLYDTAQYLVVFHAFFNSFNSCKHFGKYIWFCKEQFLFVEVVVVEEVDEVEMVVLWLVALLILSSMTT